MVGMSDEVMAHVARIDLVPLSPFGEMLARLAGRETYDVHREGDGFRLYHRDRWHIRGRPAGSIAPAWRCDVAADHWCNWPLPGMESVYDMSGISRPDPNQPPPF